MNKQIFHVSPASSFTGDIRVAGDKSISHRSIMLGSIANGVTNVSGFLQGEDSLATLAAFQQMGVNIQRSGDQVTIHGVGLHGLHKPQKQLDLGNSGTSMRLLSGLLSGQKFDSCLVGDESLTRRPMKRVTLPLSQMGAKIETSATGTPPLYISGQQQLQAIHYTLPVASAQVKSAILLAGLYATGTTTVVEPAPTRDHTERMLRGFGYAVNSDSNGTISLQGNGTLTATNIDVPSDISSAAFFLIGAAIAPLGEMVLRHVGINPTRIGVINILQDMGANIQLENRSEAGGEPVADIRIKPARLHGITIKESDVPLAIDELPILFIAAACADGTTTLTGAEELRVKESDRIAVMEQGLRKLGIDATATADGMVIQGKGSFSGGEVDSAGDHRIAMSFAIASLRATDPIHIDDCANVATSFPNFVALANQCGLQIGIDA